MSDTPELDAATNAVLTCMNTPTVKRCWRTDAPCKIEPCSCAMAFVHIALRSLATPTPEAIEAMAKALAGPGFAPVPSEYHEARVMYAALWAHILGEAKPADFQSDLSTRGNRP